MINTSLKLECLVLENNLKKVKVGYILLNLKEAQYLEDGTPITVMSFFYFIYFSSVSILV